MSIISTVTGDLIELATTSHRYKAIAHGCNCFTTMGGGIARTIREKFPMAYTEDYNFMRYMSKEAKLGKYSSHYSSRYDLTILNLYTQFKFAGMQGFTGVDYGAVEKCFTSLNRYFKLLVSNKPKQFDLGIPKIGAGLAGGDWDVIEEIISKTTPNISIELVEFNK